MYHPSGFKTSFPQANAYCVKLPGFEGPFDLLYNLVAREKVDIRDISVAHIVDQYMQYLSSMQELQINVAGEFLLMAASLLQLKSRLLLPRLPSTPGDREEEAYFFGSKEDLVRSLLAYRRFKLLAGELRRRERAQHGIFLRTPQGADVMTVNMQPSLFPYSPESLQKALVRLRERKTAEKVRKVTLPEEVSFRSIMHKILTALQKTGKAVRYLDEFLHEWNKKELVVAFFAFLELARRGRLSLVQEKLFDRIRISFNYGRLR